MESNEILNFINQFTKNGTRKEVIDCFSNGCCFWFAKVLYERFYDFANRPKFVYDRIVGHFGCKINNHIYDITGDVTNDYNWTSWNSILSTEPKRANRIMKDCIYF